MVYLLFHKQWYDTNTDRGVKHRSSLKKVRFDEENGKNSPSTGSPFRKNYNNNDLPAGNGYKVVPRENSNENLRNAMRGSKEERERSKISDSDLQVNLPNGSERLDTKMVGIRGSRNVRKRSSFKDKNVKYRARMKELNRGSIGHILDRLNIRKGLNASGKGSNMFASLPYRTGERGSRPDLIQSVMDADKRTGKEFTRRPSLEFFQDLSSQLNTGKKQEQAKVQWTDTPVTIFQNGALRASRNSLQNVSTQDELVRSSSDYEIDSITTPTPVENVKELSEEGSMNDVPVSNIDEEIAYRVVINGAELKSKKSGENLNKESAWHDRVKPATHESQSQRKIKLPKGFIGILPKYKPQVQNTGKEDTIRLEKAKKSLAKRRKSEGFDSSFPKMNSNTSNDEDRKEHYLIRSLPLPSHSNHRGAKADNAMFSNDFMESKQVCT